MTKKDMTLCAPHTWEGGTDYKGAYKWGKQLLKHAILHSAPLGALTALYSLMMEKRLTPGLTLRVLHLQCAFGFTVFGLSASWFMQLMLFVWLGWNVWSIGRHWDSKDDER